jgi:biopolymer transport protein ExbD
MSESRRAKRMNRHHARTKRKAGLNMISLMDIFTILVFFLLVSSSSVQDIPNTREIKLPDSISDKSPKETVVVMVGKDIVVQGRKVSTVTEAMSSSSLEIAPLKEELERLTNRKFGGAKTKDGKPVPREVTIMGDKQIPFDLLKKIMLTCSRANYSLISLAVMRKPQKEG